MRSRLRALLPETRSGRLLAGGIGVSAAGSGAFLASSTLYFVGQVGMRPAQVGLALSLAAVCGILSPLPVGRLADRFGAPRLYLALMVVRAAGYAGFVLVGSFPAYLALAGLVTAADRACSPLQQAVVALVEAPDRRTRALASVNAIRNAGMSLGLVLAGAVLVLPGRGGFVALFLFNAASFLVVAGTARRALRLAQPLPGTHTGPPAPPATEPLPGPGSPWRDRRYLALTAGNALLALHDSVLQVLIPAQVATRHGAPASLVPVLLGVNTLMTIFLQVPFARLAADTARARRTLGLALVPLTLACLALMGAGGLPVASAAVLTAAGVVLLTLGENLHAVAGYELSYTLSAEAQRGRYLALFQVGQSAQLVVGPVLMTAVVLPGGAPGWVLLIALLCLGTVLARGGAATERNSRIPVPH
ncbi:MFS transporter [Streptomyces sp. NPDC004561]